jgi:hypothetical protein
MKWRVSLGVALVVLLTLPTTSFGWFHSLFSRSGYRGAPAPVYYCPAPVIAVIPAAAPTPYAAPVMPPPAPQRLYAEPRAAPPSGSTVEPPRAPDTMPKVGPPTQESRKVEAKFYDAYFVAGAARAQGGDQCAVTFWNLTGQGLTLNVDGRDRVLPAGQNLRLDLKREFAWGLAGRDPQRQHVPARESGLEIVIRR